MSGILKMKKLGDALDFSRSAIRAMSTGLIILAVITAPLWLIPALIGCVVYGISSCREKCLEFKTLKSAAPIATMSPPKQSSIKSPEKEKKIVPVSTRSPSLIPQALFKPAPKTDVVLNGLSSQVIEQRTGRQP